MNSNLSFFRDPKSGSSLKCLGSAGCNTKNTKLISDDGSEYPFVDGIPRFVSSDNYAIAFGEQWMRYLKTQLDSYTGVPLSEERLARCMRGNLGKWGDGGVKILEAGSGAGRFTEILLNYGAVVHSFDYSSAVEANAKNNQESERLTLAQADIRLSVKAQFNAVRRITDLFFPIHWKFKDNKLIQKILARISPVHFYYPALKLRDRQMYYEWALLDTHDATTDFYKHYRNENEIRSYLYGLGAQDIQVTVGGNGVEAFCRKPI